MKRHFDINKHILNKTYKVILITSAPDSTCSCDGHKNCGGSGVSNCFFLWNRFRTTDTSEGWGAYR